MLTVYNHYYNTSYVKHHNLVQKCVKDALKSVWCLLKNKLFIVNFETSVKDCQKTD